MPPTAPATRAARLWEVGGQGALTAAFVGAFAWWWATSGGSPEPRVAGIHRKDALQEAVGAGGGEARHPPARPSDDSAAVALAKAGGYVPAKPGEEPTKGLRKAQ